MNTAHLMGYLGGNYETNCPQESNASKWYARNSLGITKKWIDMNGDKHEHTDWIPFTLFGKRVETLLKYSKKGDKIAFNGSINTSKYNDKTTGEVKYTWCVIVNDFEFTGKKSQNDELKDDTTPTNLKETNPQKLQEENQIPPENATNEEMPPF